MIGRAYTVVGGLVLVSVLTGCRAAGADADPAGLVSASPVTVAVPPAATVADAAAYHPAAWLSAADFPFPALAWQLVRSTDSRYDKMLALPTSTCDPRDVNDPPTTPAPAAMMTDVFWGAPRVGPGGHPEQPEATESQYFYPDATAAGAAFDVFAGAFTGCVDRAGTVAAPGTVFPDQVTPVTHHVVRTVTGDAAGAWVHQVRFPGGRPASGGASDSYMNFADSHYLAVRRGNVLDVLELVGTTAIDGPDGDASTVAVIAGRLAAYDRPPTPAALPTRWASRLWQAWPMTRRLPAPPGWTWSPYATGGVTYTNSATGGAGPLADVACTPYRDDAPDDTAPVLHDRKDYSAVPPSPERHLGASFTILTFTAPEVALAAYRRLTGDMDTCQSRVRTQQTAAGLPVDAVVTTTYRGASDAAWVLGATGFDTASAQVPAKPPVRGRTTVRIMILVAGPFVEAIDLTGDDATMEAFTIDTDRAAVDAGRRPLCNFVGVCP